MSLEKLGSQSHSILKEPRKGNTKSHLERETDGVKITAVARKPRKKAFYLKRQARTSPVEKES